jgi:hypothetical protein
MGNTVMFDLAKVFLIVVVIFSTAEIVSSEVSSQRSCGEASPVHRNRSG